MYSNLDRPTARGFYAERNSLTSDVILQSNRGVQFFKKTNFPRSRGSKIFPGFGGGGGGGISHGDLLLHPSPTVPLRTQVYQQKIDLKK